MDPVTDRLMTERQSLVERANGVLQNAAEDNRGQGRDLNDTERSTLTNFRSRIAEIDDQLAITAHDFSLREETAQAIARYAPAPGWGQQRSAADVWQSPGHVLFDYLHQGDNADSRERIRTYNRSAQANPGSPLLVRAASHMGTLAANTTTPSGDLGGLAVAPVVGPVISLGWTGMPFVSSVGLADAPNPLHWMRPRIVDAHLDDGASVQTKEKAELASQPFTAVSDLVTLTTCGGYLNISYQLLDLQAGSLDLIVNQLRRRTERQVEKAAVAKATTTTATIPLAANADAAATLAAIFDASALVYTNTGELAQWILMGPNGWSRLGGLTDLAGRPLFPTIGAANASGTAAADSFEGGVAGLRTIITPAITNENLYVGNSVGIELAAHRFPLLEAVEPSVLGRQVAVAVAFGTYQPPTTEAGPGGTPAAKYEGIVKVGT